MAEDWIIVKCMGRGIFRQYIPKEIKYFSINIYKHSDESGDKFDIKVYLSRASHSATDDMAATHAIFRTFD